MANPTVVARQMATLPSNVPFNIRGVFNGTGLNDDGSTVAVAVRWLPYDDTYRPSLFAQAGDHLLVFSGDDHAAGYEPWVWNVLANSLMPLADIMPGAGTSEPLDFTALGEGRVVFIAATPGMGRELWVTDGTAAGTRLLADINPLGLDSAITGLTGLSDGRLVFSADDGTHGRELWVTDGTPAGTGLLSDIRPGAGSGDPVQFTALADGRLVFAADDGIHGSELWVTDGTKAGTSLLKDLAVGGASSSPDSFGSLPDGRLVFAAGDAAHGRELWVTDGTAAGTSMLRDINPGPGGSDPAGYASVGDSRAFFAATDALHGRELWVTDGTTAGTKLVVDLLPGPGSSSPSEFYGEPGGRVWFSTDQIVPLYYYPDRWFSDGTSVGTGLYDPQWGPAGFYSPDSPPSTPALALGSDSGAIGDRITNVARPTLSGTYSSYTGKTVTVTDTHDGVSVVLGTVAVQADRSWRLTPDREFADGMHRIAAVGDGTNDLANSSGSNVSPVLMLTIDTTPPATPGLALASTSDSALKGDLITSDTTPTLYGTGEAGSRVTVTDLHLAAFHVLGTALVGADGTWHITASASLDDGAHQITAVATDLAGNASAGASVVLTIDTTAQTPTIRDTAWDTATATLLVSGNAAPGDVVTIRDGDIVAGTAVATANGVWTWHVPAAGLTAHTLTTSAIDAAGNQSGVSVPVEVSVLKGVATTRLSATSGIIVGSTGNDTVLLAASGKVDWSIAAGGGRNAIVLGAGRDTVMSAGQDHIQLGAGPATIIATGDATDLISGGSGQLLFVAGSGAATIAQGTGSVTVMGGSGAGVFHGGTAGNNLLIAGDGAATLFGAANGDVLYANGDHGQILHAGAGSETLFGGLSSGNDVFFAGTGKTLITGGFGNDTFVAGTGNATIQSGAGADVFKFVHGAAGGSDLIQNMDAADRIQLVGYAAGEIDRAVSGQTHTAGGTAITLSDHTRISFVGLEKVTLAVFA
jgi:ELWxxDGT repeat protein